jgi:hypothetical protein
MAQTKVEALMASYASMTQAERTEFNAMVAGYNLRGAGAQAAGKKAAATKKTAAGKSAEGGKE